MFFRDLNWVDLSTKTRCEIRLEVLVPQYHLRIEVIQHGSETSLFTVLPQSKSLKILEQHDYDLKAISSQVKIVNGNKIVVSPPPQVNCGSVSKDELNQT